MKPAKANQSKSTPPHPFCFAHTGSSIHTNSKHSKPTRSHPACVVHSKTIHSTPLLSTHSNSRLSTPIQAIVLRPMQSDRHRSHLPQPMLPRAP